MAKSLLELCLSDEISPNLVTLLNLLPLSLVDTDCTLHSMLGEDCT